MHFNPAVCTLIKIHGKVYFCVSNKKFLPYNRSFFFIYANDIDYEKIRYYPQNEELDLASPLQSPVTLCFMGSLTLDGRIIFSV